MLPFCCQILSKFVWNSHKYWLCQIVWIIRTLGQRDLSGCFLVHICVFYSSYSSYFAFLCTSSKIFRAKMEPAKFIINYSLIVIENILLATALYDSTKLLLNFSTNSLLSIAQNSNNFVESKIA